MTVGMTLEMRGDWTAATTRLRNIATRLKPDFIAQFENDGEFVLEKMRGHIDSQDLGWTPLSPHTVELKGGDTTILVETGALRDGLTVKRISSSSGLTLFVGADNSGHPSGLSMNTLMMWIEGGTDRMPPRPLIKPTIDEVQDILKDHWKDLFQDIVKGE